jgi:hypothetical protein
MIERKNGKGWQCLACFLKYDNPDYQPPPSPPTPRYGGPQGWMAR